MSKFSGRWDILDEINQMEIEELRKFAWGATLCFYALKTGRTVNVVQEFNESMIHFVSQYIAELDRCRQDKREKN